MKMSHSNTDCQKLLHALKVTVEGLLVNQVRNVWNIYGGLNRLCLAMEKIFKHGCKLSKEGFPNYEEFIRGLSKLESSVPVDVPAQNTENLPLFVKNDWSLLWIYKTLQEHQLSKKLSLLLSDRQHLISCYNEDSFLFNKQYAEAAILCLQAVEQKQPSLVAEIDPSLYISDSANSNFQRNHKRCFSLPEASYHFLKRELNKTLTVANNIDKHQSLKKYNTLSFENIQDKLVQATFEIKFFKHIKMCRSLPNLAGEKFDNEETIPKASSNSTLPNNVLQIDYTTKVNNSRVFESSPVPAIELKNCSRKKRNFHAGELKEWFVEQGKKEAVKKTFMQDGGTSVLPMSTGYFPRPMQGQSLTSFLSSEHFSRRVAELDRENAHFSISEAMISAIEQMKCNRELCLVEDVNDDDSDEEIKELKQRIRLRRRQRLEEKHLKHLWSAGLLSDGKTDTTTDQSVSPLSTSPETPSESLSTDDVEDLEVDEANNLKCLKNSDLSVSMASLYSEADVSKTKKENSESSANAENVALSLLKQFKKKQLPRASDLEWLVTKEDAPQELLPLPKSWPVSPDDAEQTEVPFLRGTTDWAPPRPQVIFTQHPTPVRRSLLSKQNFRCAGCGLRVAAEYSHKFRYCEYLGRYFCTGCHSNQLSVIPGHIIFKWSFRRYPVSTFSYRLIDQMSTDPLFPIKDLNQSLYKKVRALDKVRKLRMQLFYLKDFLFMCRFAQHLQNDMEAEPAHMFQDPEMYSLQDLIQIKSGELPSRLKELVKDCQQHVEGCQLCSARGFICELCPSKEAIYPWFIDKVSKCCRCGACYHFHCFKSGFCPRCARASARKQSALDIDY